MTRHRFAKMALPVALALLALSVLSGCAGQALAASPQAAAPALAPAPAFEAVATESETPRLATVTGTGRVSLAPDIAVVRVGVRTEHADVGQAVSDNVRLAQAVYDAVQDQGVDAKDLQTANFNVYQTTVGPREQQQRVYVVENTVIIRVRNLDTLGTVIAAALNAGANQVNGLSFTASNYDDALNQARRQALEDARAQAELMAEVLGMRLGPPRRVSFGGGQPVPRADMAYKAAMAPEAMEEVPVASGELTVTVQAYVEFDLLVP